MGSEMPQAWDLTTDVLVVGYGFAGGVAAVAAKDRGAEVLLLEKMPFPGGLSITSGGGFAVADDDEAAFQYLKRTNLNTTSDSVNRAMARGMVALPAFVKYLETKSDIKFGEDVRSLEDPDAFGMYPFPGAATIRSMKVAPDPSFRGFSWCSGMRGGARLFKLLMNNVEARNIDVCLGTAAQSLVIDDGGAVIGLRATQKQSGGESKEISILARKAIILACGGFENNDEMKLQYINVQPVYFVASRGNTGDGIRMAQMAGARLWHMWHYHGGYGFKFPEYPFAFRHTIAGPRVPTRKMPWILLDKYGRRFMNEYPPAVQDTAARELSFYDPEQQEYPRVPAKLVFDEEGRKLRPIGFPIFTGGDIEPYVWSNDNLKEVQSGWIHKADTRQQLAQGLGLSYEKLNEALDRWNAMCQIGRDEDHGRLPGTMVPIATPPFYWIDAWPIVNNTQGGPVHDEFQRVINADNEPIPRLYSAGDLGSLFGHLYLEAGNVAECFVSGRIAGEHAAELGSHVSAT